MGKKILAWVMALAMLCSLMPSMGLTALAAEQVSYLCPVSGGTSSNLQWKNASVSNYKEVSASDTTWGTEKTKWYVASGTVTIDHTVTCNGDICLILADGAKLTVNGDSSHAGIHVTESSSLTIYAQSTSSGMGKLVAAGSFGGSDCGAGIGGNSGESNGKITINGGKVTATGGHRGAGIGGGSGGDGSNITINGGIVTAANGDGTGSIGAGIGGGGYNGKRSGNGKNITINGGAVKATTWASANSAIGGGGVGVGGDSTKNGSGSNIQISTNLNVVNSAGETIAYALDYSEALNGIKSVIITHRGDHYLVYDTDENAITATCQTEGCYYTDAPANPARLTLEAPTEANCTYNGREKEATLNTKNWDSSFGIPQISYQKKIDATWTNIDGAPIDAGDYQASITLKDRLGEEYTAKVQYTIKQKKLSIQKNNDVTGVTTTTVADKTYDGTTDATVTVGTVKGIVVADQNSESRLKVTATGTFKNKNASDSPKSVTVEYQLEGSAAGNYIAPDTDTVSATISKKEVALTWPTLTNLVFNGAPQAVTPTTTDIVTADQNTVTVTAQATDTNADITNVTGQPFTYTASFVGDDSGNYTIKSGEVSPKYTVTKHELTIDTAEIAEKTYDGTKTGTVDRVGFNGLQGSDALALDVDYTATAEFDSANADGSDKAKTATVTVNLIDTAITRNYNLPSSIKIVDKGINKAEITSNPIVTLNGWTVGNNPNTPQVTDLPADFPAETQIQYFYKVKDTDDSTKTDVIPTEIGNYTVIAVIPETDNYLSKTIYGDFTISKHTTKTYSVTINAAENGTVMADKTRAAKGKTVTLTLLPDDGYGVDTVTVTDARGNAVSVTERGTFTMPGSNVTVTATFQKVDSVPLAKALPFVDVTATDWHYGAVSYTYENDLMNGVSETEFAPGDTSTRAMVATMLWRKAGSPVVDYAMPFTDVPADQWYTEAVRWAASTGVVKGVSETKFASNADVTREQLATMVYRYEQSQGSGFVGDWMFLLPQNDAASVSEWADEGMHWCVMKQVMQGDDKNNLNPQNEATRAELATVFMNWDNAE